MKATGQYEQPRCGRRSAAVGPDEQSDRGHLHDATEVQLVHDVVVGRIGQGQDDKVGEQEAILVVLHPQGPEAEGSGIGMADDRDVGPLVGIDGVESVPVDQPEVRHHRQGEPEDGQCVRPPRQRDERGDRVLSGRCRRLGRRWPVGLTGGTLDGPLHSDSTAPPHPCIPESPHPGMRVSRRWDRGWRPSPSGRLLPQEPPRYSGGMLRGHFGPGLQASQCQSPLLEPGGQEQAGEHHGHTDVAHGLDVDAGERELGGLSRRRMGGIIGQRRRARRPYRFRPRWRPGTADRSHR